MTLEEARRIWGPDIPEDILREWVDSVNERQKVCHLDTEPKGETIEIKNTLNELVEAYRNIERRAKFVR
jgi:hypothetical protein